MKAVRSNLPKLARVPLDIGGQFTSWSFGNDFCAHGIIPNCSLFNFIHMRYDDTINVENNIGIKEFISNH